MWLNNQSLVSDKTLLRLPKETGVTAKLHAPQAIWPLILFSCPELSWLVLFLVGGCQFHEGRIWVLPCTFGEFAVLTWGWCLFCQFTLCLTLSSSLSEAPAVCPWLGLRILCFQHSCPIPGVRLTDIISVRAELSLSSVLTRQWI